MLERLKTDFVNNDDRGSLCQIYHNTGVQINSLITNKGVERGNHYHKLATEYFYVIKGRVVVKCEDGEHKQEEEFSEGGFFVIRPFTMHSMFFKEDTIMVAFYDRPIESQSGEKDIYRE